MMDKVGNKAAKLGNRDDQGAAPNIALRSSTMRSRRMAAAASRMTSALPTCTRGTAPCGSPTALTKCMVLIWVGTGLFFAANPIDQVRGAHLRKDPPPAAIDWARVKTPPEIAAAAVAVSTVDIELRMIDGAPTYVVRAAGGASALVDAETGGARPVIDAAAAARTAQASYTGAGQAAAPIWLTAKTSEYRGPVPAWRVDFTGADAAALYIDAATGDVKAVRTPLWRLYDALWGLHIMDWRDRENFNSMLLIFASALAGVLALVGLGLTAYRLVRGMKQRAA
jgi:hypothetical protein